MARLATIALTLALAGCARTEVWIPTEVQSFESSGMTIYGKGRDGTPSAIGQLFELPVTPADLRGVGFLTMYPLQVAIAPGVTTTSVRVRLLLSAWDGAKPAWPPLWQSAPVEITKTSGDLSTIDWLWFAAPPLRLEPGRKYLAWLTMAGMENNAADTISVVRMGPRSTFPRPGRHSLYPEGAMAIWSGANPDDMLTPMSGSAWAIENPAVNLHFRMLFQ